MVVHVVMHHRMVMMAVMHDHGFGLGRGAEGGKGNEPEEGGGDEFFHRSFGLLNSETLVLAVYSQFNHELAAKARESL